MAMSPSLRIAGLYAIASILWILLSDRAVQWVSHDPETLIALQTLKGWFFVGITALLLHQLIRQQMSRLNRMNAELEDRVLERTRRLEQMNHELESFTYTVSHDLKAPLRAIDGFGSLLQSQHADSLPDEANHYIQRMRQAAARMNRLIEDLLSYSRIERRELHLRTLSLQQQIERLLEEQSEQIQEVGAVTSVDVECDEVMADPEGLLLVFRNLLENSLKFNKEGKPQVSIHSYQKKDRCIIEFRDNGIGFEPEYSDRIFQIFQRLHPESVFPGTGIGLAIARKAMTRMNGTISASSRPGEGATFTLTLQIPSTRPAGPAPHA